MYLIKRTSTLSNRIHLRIYPASTKWTNDVKACSTRACFPWQVFPVVFSVTGRPCRIPASFPRRAASEALELGASTWQAGCARIKNSSCFPCRYSTRTSFLVEKLALLAFQQGKRDEEKVSLLPFYTIKFSPTRKTRHWKHARVE